MVLQTTESKSFVYVLNNKRNFKKRKDDDLIAAQNLDQREFWKKIGSIGVANARQSTIPLQVESENGSITNDIPTVLQKWKNDFSNLFNPNENEILDNEANILMSNENVPPTKV